MGDLTVPPIIDYDEIAKRVWERSIPAVPASGAFEEKFKQTIARYEFGEASGSVSVAAGASVSVAVQPPTGETWETGASCRITTTAAGTWVGVSINDGVADIGGRYIKPDGGHPYPYVSLNSYITNSIYFELEGRNADGVAQTFDYLYKYFKVRASSMRISKLEATERLIRELEIIQRVSREPEVPDYLLALEDRCFIDHQGDDALHLEKDVPLRKDEADNIIERLSIWVKLKDFERLFSDIIADPAKRPIMHYIKERDADGKMGWLRYMVKFEGEGIEC